MRRTAASLTVLLLGAGLLGAALARSADATSGVRDGGTFHVAVIGADFHYIDPALAESLSELPLLDLTCARLMRYPDKPPPEGFRLIPEVAADYPRRLARREDLHVHAPPRSPRFSLQQRGACDGERVRHGDQPNARAGGRVVRHRLHGRHRGGGGGAGRHSAERRQGSRHAGQIPPRHQAETPKRRTSRRV